MDRAPAQFLSGSRTSSSLVSAGCIIEGTVVNSVLSPGVWVKKGAVVTNSVVFEDCVLEEQAKVDLAILDKRELRDFLKGFDLKAVDAPAVQVYGSPAFHGGTCWSVLLSKRRDGVLLQALVTPYCEWKERHTDRDWNRLERAFRNTYKKEGV